VLAGACLFAITLTVSKITETAVRAIYKVISDNLTSINAYLASIEKQVEDSIRLVIYSPQLSGSEVMSFLISSQMQDKNPSYSDLDPIINFQKKQGLLLKFNALSNHLTGLLDLHRTLEVDKVNRGKNAVAYSGIICRNI
jgi:hypothetical protein